MTYSTLGVLTADRNGISIADAALTASVAGGHSFTNDGPTQLVLLNTNAASRTVTVRIPGLIDGVGVTGSGTVITLGAGNVTAVRILTTIFPRTIYNQSDGTVLIDYSATAGLSVAAVRIPREMVL